MAVEVVNVHCMSWLAARAENSIDAIVTDPPYGFGFLGAEWDKLPPGRLIQSRIARAVARAI